MKYRVILLYICDDSSVNLEYNVVARDEAQARIRGMARFRRTFLGGDLYEKLKNERSFFRGNNEFVWKNFDGGRCIVRIDGVSRG